MNKNKRLIYISLLAAQGVVITMLERAIPFPFAFAPGAKLGLANIITLLAIFTLPYKDSFKVVWMRLLISTLLGGTLSTFLYSFAGAFLSYGGMLLVRLLGPKRVSVIGISATGGILHNVGQLAMASLIAQSFSVMLYLPILSITGICQALLRLDGFNGIDITGKKMSLPLQFLQHFPGMSAISQCGIKAAHPGPDLQH